jgi:DNA-binding transcriptional ArsR family regulator
MTVEQAIIIDVRDTSYNGDGMGMLTTEAVESTTTHDALAHPRRDQIELAAVLHALSDPVRLRIVAGLADGDERTCKSFDVPVVKSTCTHHFRVLRDAGVIRQRQEGTARLNSLRREDLEQRFPGLLAAVLSAARL